MKNDPLDCRKYRVKSVRKTHFGYAFKITWTSGKVEVIPTDFLAYYIYPRYRCAVDLDAAKALERKYRRKPRKS